MIARIRVEARAASMEEAKREIEVVLAHAQMAALLEGLTRGLATTVDNHFGDVYGNDAWTQHGMGAEGRIVVAFDPAGNPGGGLKQFGYGVLIDVGDEIRSAEDGKEVADAVFVLNRVFPVTREHSWESDPVKDSSASAEEILDNIRRLVNVEDVEVAFDRTQRDRSGWRVNVTFVPDPPDAAPMCASAGAATLREAALQAYGMCGVEVLHFDTEPPNAPSGSATVTRTGPVLTG